MLGETALGLVLLFQGSVGDGVAIVVLLCAAVIGSLIPLLWRDMRGKMGASIILTNAGMRLDLGAGRSATNRTSPVHELIAYTDMEAIEMRIEAYPAQRMAKMNRTFRLTRRNGPAVFLFEERGLGMFEDGIMAPLTREIAERAQISLKELGIVEGGGGLFAAWFVRVPDWTAPAVTAARAQALWNLANRTNMIASILPYGS